MDGISEAGSTTSPQMMGQEEDGEGVETELGAADAPLSPLEFLCMSSYVHPTGLHFIVSWSVGYSSYDTLAAIM